MIKSVILIAVACLIHLHVSQALDKNERIIGGTTAVAGEYPFVVGIYKSTTSGTYFCAGTLLYNQWVLTAGQCVADGILFTIRIGSHHLTSNDPNAIRVATDQYFLHPDFNPDTLENDIALIKLRQPVELTDYIKPISLLSSASLQPGATVLTAGWGQTSDEAAGLVEELNVVSLVTLSNKECKLTYGNQITDNMVCAAGNYNEGLCKGDVGGPLFQRGLILNYHVGIASFISSRGCESSDPSGFTRTAPYFNWIQNITSTY